MNRAEKSSQIAVLKEGFKSANNAFLVGFSGLSVKQVTDLRGQIRAASSSYLVVKNRLAILAVEGTPMEPLASRFVGPTAVAYNDNDPVGLAKILAGFAKENEALTLRVAVIEGKTVIEDEEVQELSKLPSLPELQAQLLSVLLAPATQLARLLNTPGKQLAQVIQARKDNLSESGQ